MKIIKAIKDFKNSLKDGLKPFYIVVLLFGAIYTILSIFGYLIWIVASRLRMNRRFRKKRIEDGEENYGKENN